MTDFAQLVSATKDRRTINREQSKITWLNINIWNKYNFKFDYDLKNVIDVTHLIWTEHITRYLLNFDIYFVSFRS